MSSDLGGASTWQVCEMRWFMYSLLMISLGLVNWGKEWLFWECYGA
jgi:hypothetical protein